MQHKEYKIDLEEYRAKKGSIVSKVFTGRDRGKMVREKCNIDNIFMEYECIQIIIPEDIRSINPSFFEELFSTVVRKLGKDKFLEKFKFESRGGYSYDTPLHEAIQRILRDKTALG